MLRTFGIVLIIAAAAGIGAVYSAALRRECRIVSAFISLLRLIRTRIDCFNQPLFEIYRDFDGGRVLPSGFTDDLCKNGFFHAFDGFRETFALEPEISEILSDIGKELGKSDRDDQIRLCDRGISELGDKLSVLESEFPKRSRAAQALFSALGLMTAIILI